jgi:hypothetical protein
MAHPIVEKVKHFGLLHGEKVGVGLAVALTAGLLFLAITRDSISTTPKQISEAAERAQRNISRKVDEKDLENRFAEQGIKSYDFEQVVLSRAGADASKYRLAGSFVLPEPGAGLICDQPELIAPENLYAHAARGAVRVYETDEQGRIVYEEEEPKEKKTATRRNRGMTGMPGYSNSGYGSMMMGGMGRGLGGGGGSTSKTGESAEKSRLERSLVGGKAAASAASKEKGEEQVDELKGTPKEILRGYRVVTIVGTLNHKALRDLYAKALKLDPADARTNPHYARIEMERQELNKDGSWSEWTLVDRSPNEEIVRILQKKEEELARDDTLLEALVDPLPFFEVGYWAGVHVASLAKTESLKELVEQPEQRTGPGRGAGMPGMMGGENEAAMRGRGMGGGDYGSMMARGGGGSGNMMEAMRGGGRGALGGDDSTPGMGGLGGSAEANYPKTDAETVLVRAIDYTVEPDSVYRYRLRIVVNNPNYKRQNVAPGVDNTSKELTGPWSEPTASVDVLDDVATYALGKAPQPAERKSAAVQFQVVRWDAVTGLTIVKTFDHAPGQIVGDVIAAAVPKHPDFKGTTSQTVDFVTRQIMLDAVGGDRSLALLGQEGKRLNAPAAALLIRPDGLLVLRDQVRDAASGEVKEMDEIYRKTLEDARPESRKSTSLMGGYGMSGGGMGPGGR